MGAGEPAAAPAPEGAAPAEAAEAAEKLPPPHLAVAPSCGLYSPLDWEAVARQPVHCALKGAVPSGKWVLTDARHKLCIEGSLFCGIQRISMSGSCLVAPGATLRGDLAKISLGKFTCVGERAILRPAPARVGSRGLKGQINQPLLVGDHVLVDEGACVEAQQISNCVLIGRNSIIGARCTVRQGVWVLPDALVLPEQVLPSFTVWGGDPAECVGYLHEGALDEIRHLCRQEYARYVIGGPA
eukprot:TRINITY_DN13062_c0_g1_i1.p2 TRINITY_DN13062_c0_g1~~TRINITY_DN13062_c0_g1_i1.p2  ORF type:complete len:242 (+),score=58.12 TRINITY_DN13062_c0_g1_i1:65-790(+)